MSPCGCGPYKLSVCGLLSNPISSVFGLLTYYGFSTLSYIFVFDKETMKHPKYLKSQIRLEMRQAISGMFGMALRTTPLFLAR